MKNRSTLILVVFLAAVVVGIFFELSNQSNQNTLVEENSSLADDLEKKIVDFEHETNQIDDFKTDLIRIDSPDPQEEVGSPIIVSGEARGYWFFEASFPITVVDWDGRIIGDGFATADGEWMTEEFVPFSGQINYVLPADTPYKRGAIIFRKDNPSGLLEHDDALEIPVVFE